MRPYQSLNHRFIEGVSMARSNAPLALVIVAAALAACDTASETAAPSSEPSAAVLAADQANNPEVVSQQINGFGGMFIDEAGRPTVYLTNMSEAAKARRVLQEFAAENGASENEIQFLPATFRFTQLNSWYDRTWPEVMDKAGTVFSDLDEAHNRILFGVEHAGLATAVAAIMRAHGVPADAYAVEVTEPIQTAATLRDNVNPKVGGLQIHFTQYLCTLGFNVTQNGATHFVTNSHCTATQGGVENTVYYQPTSTVAPSPIATEIKDPVYVRGGGTGCPRSKRCRVSDSSLARYNSGVSATVGGLATTNGSNLTITGTLNITAEGTGTAPAPVGSSVSKTGRTTGTSTGNVTNTCVNTSVSGSNIMQLCQTFVSATVGAGDSGSPVRQGSTLVGILWGGNQSGSQFVFSPLASIKSDLGTFTAH
jgi:hypothetical protein